MMNQVISRTPQYLDAPPISAIYKIKRIADGTVDVCPRRIIRIIVAPICGPDNVPNRPSGIDRRNDRGRREGWLVNLELILEVGLHCGFAAVMILPLYRN